MSRPKKGSIAVKNGKLYARVQFIDESGKKRDLWRTASNKKDAKEKIKDLIKNSETKTPKELDAARMSLNQLIDFYEEVYLHEAIYINERKMSGIRNIKPNQYNLKTLRAHLGNQLIQSIQHTHILNFKLKRLHTPLKNGSQRSIASVNRELQMLRRLINIGIRQGWLTRNAFKEGDSLISLADESHRTRILSFAEEMRLLSAIDSEPLRFNLKGILLIALDCALRKNEILTLERKDVDLINKTITIRAFNSKTAKSRKVGLTNRVYEWLLQYEDFKPDERIFPIKCFNTIWYKSLKTAAIEDFHFHDCRATSISRLISAGLAPAEVMRISGHSTMSCLYRYIRTDDSTIFRAVNALDFYLASNAFSNEIFDTVM